MWYVAIATIDYQTNKYGVIQLEFILFLYVGCKFLFLVLSLAVTTLSDMPKERPTSQKNGSRLTIWLVGLAACKLYCYTLWTSHSLGWWAFFGMMSLAQAMAPVWELPMMTKCTPDIILLQGNLWWSRSPRIYEKEACITDPHPQKPNVQHYRDIKHLEFMGTK